MRKEKKYIKKNLREEHELLSIMGNVSFVDNEHFVHSHVVLADRDYKSFGGHLFDAQISATGEFKIDLLNCEVSRNFSKEIGLNLWCI